MSKDFILTTDELFGSYCYIEQKRYGVPNEKFLYKIIGKFTSNSWSNVPVDANDKEPHIFNHSEEVVNVVCCGVCEDKIERYKLSDVEIISNKDQQLANLEAKLAEKDAERELDNSFWKQECDSLQKTLAEKEKEIEQVTSKLQASYEKEQNQKAIEQLEKLKEEIDKRPLAVRNCGYGEFEEILLDDVYDVIDNQINGLKGENK